jgi:hypothetical protein
MAACIPFDFNRFTNVANQVPSLNGGAALALITQLYQDYQAAVRNSRIRCNDNAINIESFYVGTLFMGFASVRTTCFSCQFPLQAGAVNMIRNDLAQFQNGLTAFANCLSPVRSRENNTITGQIALVSSRLGVVSGIESYNDTVALYQMAQTALRDSPCVCRCADGVSNAVTYECPCCGTMQFTWNGNAVTGTYSWSGGGKVVGTMQGNTLVGKWSDSNGRGNTRYEFTPDRSGFEHFWQWEGSTVWSNAGICTRK